QTRAQAECAVQHPLPHEIAHLLEFLRRRLTIDQSDDLLAYRSLPDEQSEVRRDMNAGQTIEKRLDWQRRRPVGTFHQRRDALTHVVVRRGHVEDAAARMC